jgi:hypothetical protein
LEEVKHLKKAKAFFSGICKKIKQKSLEKNKIIWSEEMAREISTWHNLFQKLHGDDEQNEKYNVFVYDTILYPPGSSDHFRLK